MYIRVRYLVFCEVALKIITVTIMEFATKLLGGYISDLINIRQFKEDHSYCAQQLKLSKITERTIIEKLHSINPNIDLSNLVDEMKASKTKLKKHMYHEVFSSPEILGSRCILPIYGSICSKLQILNHVKSDLCQAKRTRMYVSPPSFTPRGNIIPGKTLLITVILYHPFRWMHGQVPDEAVKPHCKISIQFHESQTLEDVRKAFVCQNLDSEISGDVSDNPHKPLEFLGNNDLKHALFYINNNIYVDSQLDKITKEHTVTMKKWAQDNGHTFGDVLPLDTQLIDLEVRIGEPYIYQHLGRCEHLFIFNEICFAQPNSSLGFSSYPRIVSISKEKLKNCIYCNQGISDVAMICEDDRTPITVNHMCESCFLSYNYNNIGEKIASFKAYRSFKYRE